MQLSALIGAMYKDREKEEGGGAVYNGNPLYPKHEQMNSFSWIKYVHR